MDPHEIAAEAQKKRQQWKAKRDRLFEQYLKNPSNTSLALEIKAIDDLVAQSIEGTKTKPPTRS
ncbi:MAG TPA: hypothetical protein VKT53_08750 [Candidatus Acidoferrum sp.]|nr:hypothetical protein [Candidatus Acidoferrum sp.]